MIVKSNKTHGHGMKAVAVFVNFMFAMTSVLWTGPVIAAPSDTAAPIHFSVDSIVIPPEIGSISNKYFGERGTEKKSEAKNNRTVILIQDAHAVVDAQESIAKLLELFQKQYGIRLAALEGARSKLDPTLFRTFPDTALEKKVLSGYLKRGEISGVEMAAIFSEKEQGYYGIEDWKLYEENYRAYRRAQEARSSLETKWKAFKNQLDEKRKSVYSEKLNEFQDRWEDFRAERTNLAEFLMYLVNFKKILAGDKELAGLNKLVDSVGYVASGNQEKLIPVIKAMAAEFKAKYVRGMDIKDEMNFYNRYQAFLTGKMESGSFLQYMIALGHARGFRPKLTPSIRRLLGHTETLSAIMGSELFNELERCQEAIEASLMTRPEEKTIALQYRRLFLLQELFSLALTHETLAQFQADPGSYLDLLGDADFKQGLAPAVEFYKLALERDQAFYRNLKARMDEQKQDAAVVVAGGFHTNGLRRILEQQKIRYAVVSPRMDSLTGSENYAKVMQDELSYKQFLKTTYYDAFVRDATEQLVQDMNQPEFVRQLKVWREEVIRDLSRQGRIAEAGRYTRYLDALAQVYVSKFGKGPARNRDEILKILAKALNDFRDQSLTGLWQRFEFQLTQLADGFKGLAQRSELNPKNISILLDGFRNGKASTLNSPAVLDQNIPILSAGLPRSETRTPATTSVEEEEVETDMSPSSDPLILEGRQWLRNFRVQLRGATEETDVRLGNAPGDVLYPSTDPAYLMALRYLLPEIKSGNRILEMGVGSGVFLGMLAAFLKTKGVLADCVGIDVNENAVKLARRMLQTLGKSVQIRLGDLFRPVRGEKFDIIFWNAPWFRKLLEGKDHGIQMVDQDYKTVMRFLKEAPDHLTPGGRLYLLFPVKLFNVIEKQIPYPFDLKTSYKNGRNLEIGLFEYDPMAARRPGFSETPKLKKKSFFSVARDLEEEGQRRVSRYFRAAAKREVTGAIAMEGPMGMTRGWFSRSEIRGFRIPNVAIPVNAVVARHDILGTMIDAKQLVLDKEQWKRLYEDLHRLEEKTFAMRIRDEWRRWFEDRNYAVYGLVRDGQLTGAIVGNIFPNGTTVRIGPLMSLNDSYRGKGQFLMDAFVSRMLREKRTHIQWTSEKGAQPFYDDYIASRQAAGILEKIPREFAFEYAVQLNTDPLDPQKWDLLRTSWGLRSERPESARELAMTGTARSESREANRAGLPIEKDQLEKILAAYGITRFESAAVQGKPDVMLVERTEKGDFVLKRPQFRNQPSYIEWEASVLDQLGRNGIRVAGIERTQDGKPYVRVGDAYFVLYKELTGKNDYGWGDIEGDQLIAAAKVLAQVHQALKDFEPAQQNYREEDLPQVFPVNAVEQGLKKLEVLHEQIQARAPPEQNGTDRIFLEQWEKIDSWVNKLREKLDAASLRELPETIVHGDYQQSNLFFQSDGGVALTDFEYAHRDKRIFDLANALILRFLGRDPSDRSSIDMDKIERFVAAYDDALPLTEKLTSKEIELLPYVYALGYLEGVHMFAGILRAKNLRVPLLEQLANLDVLAHGTEKLSQRLQSRLGADAARSESRAFITPEEEAAEETRLMRISDAMMNEGFEFGNENGSIRGNSAGLLSYEARARIVSALIWGYQTTGFKPTDDASLRDVLHVMNDVFFVVGIKERGDPNRISVAAEAQALYGQLKDLPDDAETFAAKLSKFKDEHALPRPEPQPLEEGFKSKVREFFDRWDLLSPEVKLEIEGKRYVDLGAPEIQAALKGVPMITQEPERVFTRYTDGEFLAESYERFDMGKTGALEWRNMVTLDKNEVKIVFVKEKMNGKGYEADPFLIDTVGLNKLSLTFLEDHGCLKEYRGDVIKTANKYYEAYVESAGPRDDAKPQSNYRVKAYLVQGKLEVEVVRVDYRGGRSEAREEAGLLSGLPHYQGFDVVEIYKDIIKDKALLDLMEKILTATYTEFLKEKGAAFVQECFDRLHALEAKAEAGTLTTEEVKATFRGLRDLFKQKDLEKAYYGDFRDKNLDRSLSLAQESFSGVVVDLGADDNRLGDRLLKLYGERITKVIGVDIEERDNVRKGEKLDFRVQRGTMLPFKDGEVNTVVVRYALHHMTLAEQQEYLREIQRVLAPQGKIIVYEDTYDPEGGGATDTRNFQEDLKALDLRPERLQLLLAGLDSFSQAVKDKNQPFPSNYRTFQGWTTFFEKAGFAVERKYYGIPVYDLHQAPLGVFILTKQAVQAEKIGEMGQEQRSEARVEEGSAAQDLAMLEVWLSSAKKTLEERGLSLDKRFAAKWHGRLAAEIPVAEGTRDGKAPSTTNQYRYWINLVRAREALLQFMESFDPAGTDAIEAFTHFLEESNTIQLTGINGDLIYVTSLIGRWVFVKNLEAKAKGLTQVSPETYTLETAGKIRVDPARIQRIWDAFKELAAAEGTGVATAAGRFYEVSIERPYVFESGNNSVFMNILNGMLRLKGVTGGLSHDYYEEELGREPAGTLSQRVASDVTKLTSLQGAGTITNAQIKERMDRQLSLASGQEVTPLQVPEFVGPEFQDQVNRVIEPVLAKGGVIAVDLYRLADLNGRLDRFIPAMNLLAEAVKKVLEAAHPELSEGDYRIPYVFQELFKNAFYHGNGMEFDLPVYIKVDAPAMKISLYDFGKGTPQDEALRNEATKTWKISGDGAGVDTLQDLDWEYSRPADVVDAGGAVVGKVTGVQLPAQEIKSRSEVREISFGELRVKAEPTEIAEKAAASGGIEAVRSELREKGQLELKRIQTAYDKSAAAFLTENGKQSDIVGFMVSPECAERLKGETQFGGLAGVLDIQALYEAMLSAVVMPAAMAEEVKFADAGKALDRGKIKAERLALGAWIDNARSQRIAILMNRPAQTQDTEQVLKMIGQIPVEQLIVLHQRGQPLGSMWRTAAQGRFTPVSVKGDDKVAAMAQKIAASQEGQLMVSFWTQDFKTGDLGIYSILAEVNRISDPELKSLALSAVHYAILRFATLDQATRKTIIANPSEIKKYLDQGIAALSFFKFGKSGLELAVEQFVNNYLAERSIQAAA